MKRENKLEEKDWGYLRQCIVGASLGIMVIAAGEMLLKDPISLAWYGLTYAYKSVQESFFNVHDITRKMDADTSKTSIDTLVNNYHKNYLPIKK